MNMLKKRNQKGFTLIEIIAVLVILGILAAVAIPKYMDMQAEARIKAAQAAISETKARLSTGYAIALLKANGGTVTTAMVQANANIAAGSWGPDYNVAVTAADPAVITVDKVQTVTITPVTGYWNLPSP
jgi:prepilin-type N-terminal cleavage/methylation domain-containing protein